MVSGGGRASAPRALARGFAGDSEARRARRACRIRRARAEPRRRDALQRRPRVNEGSRREESAFEPRPPDPAHRRLVNAVAKWKLRCTEMFAAFLGRLVLRACPRPVGRGGTFMDFSRLNRSKGVKV